MSSLPMQVVDMFSETIAKVVPITIVLALVFSVLSHFWACNPGTPWWRKRELITDICYWFFVPLFARVLRIGLLVLGAAVIFKIHDPDELIGFYENGHGPLSELPLWCQALLFLVLSDFMLYWLHRMFHGGGSGSITRSIIPRKSWSGFRRRVSTRQNLFLGTILVDVLLLMAGSRPTSCSGSARSRHSIRRSSTPISTGRWVRSDTCWRRRCSHRWHHTSLEEGGNTNFAGTFPIWDILFGTFRMPANRLPEQYGIDGAPMPTEIVGQLAYPFRQ